MLNKVLRVVFAFWILFIVSLSVVPLKVKIHIGTTGKWHNAGHFSMFFIATALACWMVNNLYAKLACCLGIVGVAFGMEWMEHVSYHILYEWRDIWFDCSGIVFGFALMITVMNSLHALPARGSARHGFASPTYRE